MCEFAENEACWENQPEKWTQTCITNSAHGERRHWNNRGKSPDEEQNKRNQVSGEKWSTSAVKAAENPDENKNVVIRTR